MVEPRNLTYTVSPPARLGAMQVELPASKSLSARALVISALAGGTGGVRNVARCDDTDVMLSALEAERRGCAEVDVHGAGTAMRFLTAYFSLRPARVEIDGSARMRQRPIGILVDALRSLGASIRYAGDEGFPPLTVGGGAMRGGELRLAASVSSQYVSALLMIAPMLAGGLRLTLEGRIASRPYIEMTLALMRSYGARAEWQGCDTICVEEGGYKARPYSVESDWSAASYWYEMLALAPAGSGPLTLKGLAAESLQGDARVAEYFQALGVATRFGDEGAILEKCGAPAERLDADLGGEPDLAQTLIATCCALGVKFRLGGLANLRVKETDRIAAMETELAKLGFAVGDDGAGTVEWGGGRTTPACGRAATIATYDDHRMAMSLAPLCLRLGSIAVADPAVVAKSYPGYWDGLREAGFGVRQE